jgi:hypothetical protein
MMRAFFWLKCLAALLTFSFSRANVSPMHSNTTPVTTAELRLAYRRAGLFRFGYSFEQACAAGLVRWAMEKSALAVRRSGNHPAQLRLI